MSHPWILRLISPSPRHRKVTPLGIGFVAGIARLVGILQLSGRPPGWPAIRTWLEGGVVAALVGVFARYSRADRVAAIRAKPVAVLEGVVVDAELAVDAHGEGARVGDKAGRGLACRGGPMGAGLDGILPACISSNLARCVVKADQLPPFPNPAVGPPVPSAIRIGVPGAAAVRAHGEDRGGGPGPTQSSAFPWWSCSLVQREFSR